MRLTAYLAEPGRNATILAKQCGVAVSTITRAANGRKKPSLDLMVRIRDATRNAVSADDFLPPYVDQAIDGACRSRVSGADDASVEAR